jgi:hypothetical protein
MFNNQILEVLKRNDRENKFDTYGSPVMFSTDIDQHRELRGGKRYGLHPTPEMDFQPDDLYTGREMYDRVKPHMMPAGVRPLREQGRMSGGMSRMVHPMEGGSLKSFGRSVMRGLKKVGRTLEPVGKYIGKDIIMPVVKDFATKQGRKMLEQGLEKYGPMVAEGALMAAGRPRRKSSGGRMVGGRREARGTLIRQIMREQGCSLPEASRYIKEHGIEY